MLQSHCCPHRSDNVYRHPTEAQVKVRARASRRKRWQAQRSRPTSGEIENIPDSSRPSTSSKDVISPLRDSLKQTFGISCTCSKSQKTEQRAAAAIHTDDVPSYCSDHDHVVGVVFKTTTLTERKWQSERLRFSARRIGESTQNGETRSAAATGGMMHSNWDGVHHLIMHKSHSSDNRSHAAMSRHSAARAAKQAIPLQRRSTRRCEGEAGCARHTLHGEQMRGSRMCTNRSPMHMRAIVGTGSSSQALLRRVIGGCTKKQKKGDGKPAHHPG
jgi:hypothetical protein